jgi:hypothetical protein
VDTVEEVCNSQHETTMTKPNEKQELTFVEKEKLSHTSGAHLPLVKPCK